MDQADIRTSVTSSDLSWAASAAGSWPFDILHVRNDEVAFGVKWTSMGGQDWVAQSRLTPSRHTKAVHEA
jgi:hypothetical protein